MGKYSQRRIDFSEELGSNSGQVKSQNQLGEKVCIIICCSTPARSSKKDQRSCYAMSYIQTIREKFLKTQSISGSDPARIAWVPLKSMGLFRDGARVFSVGVRCQD